MGSPEYYAEISVARLNGVLGADVTCRKHGRIGWCRTALAHDLIAAHVRRYHTLAAGGVSSKVVGVLAPDGVGG